MIVRDRLGELSKREHCWREGADDERTKLRSFPDYGSGLYGD